MLTGFLRVTSSIWTVCPGIRSTDECTAATIATELQPRFRSSRSRTKRRLDVSGRINNFAGTKFLAAHQNFGRRHETHRLHLPDPQRPRILAHDAVGERHAGWRDVRQPGL